MAVCLEDEEQRIAELARLFFSELAKKEYKASMVVVVVSRRGVFTWRHGVCVCVLRRPLGVCNMPVRWGQGRAGIHGWEGGEVRPFSLLVWRRIALALCCWSPHDRCVAAGTAPCSHLTPIPTSSGPQTTPTRRAPTPSTTCCPTSSPACPACGWRSGGSRPSWTRQAAATACVLTLCVCVCWG